MPTHSTRSAALTSASIWSITSSGVMHSAAVRCGGAEGMALRASRARACTRSRQGAGAQEAALPRPSLPSTTLESSPVSAPSPSSYIMTLKRSRPPSQPGAAHGSACLARICGGGWGARRLERRRAARAGRLARRACSPAPLTSPRAARGPQDPPARSQTASLPRQPARKRAPPGPRLLGERGGHGAGGVALGADQVPHVAVHLHRHPRRVALVVPGVHAHLAGAGRGARVSGPGRRPGARRRRRHGWQAASGGAGLATQAGVAGFCCGCKPGSAAPACSARPSMFRV